MPKLLLPVLAALLTAAGTAAFATAEKGADKRAEKGVYAIGLWGDLPYSETQRSSGVPNLVADMNRQRLAFTIHDGDIKAGGERCDDPIYTQLKSSLNSLEAPAFYTPGDNEWTDCDRPTNGPYDSEERLGLIRREFFSAPSSLGQRRLAAEQQAAPYVENLRFSAGRVTYATLHVVGSDNNRSGDVAPDPVEYEARNEATNAWLRESFAAARAADSAGIMLTIQANPGFDRSDPTRAPLRDPRTLEPRDGFYDFLTALREETIAFGRPVVLVHGDSHYFRIDKPFQDAEGRRLETFTRVETQGNNAPNANNDVHWTKAIVDPKSREVFSFEQQVVPANRVAVPAR